MQQVQIELEKPQSELNLIFRKFLHLQNRAAIDVVLLHAIINDRIHRLAYLLFVAALSDEGIDF